MIQDIYPHVYNNTFEPGVKPSNDDIIFSFEEDQVLMKDEHQFYHYHEISKESICYYLFSIDDTKFFLADLTSLNHIKVSFRTMRTFEDQMLGFAAITAWHLYRWIQDNKYCGKCGHPMDFDQKERAMRCPHCSNIVYPKISPAVIVGITNEKGQILVTKYAHGHYQSYALVAGFCEIGETIEETVKREVKEETGLKLDIEKTKENFIEDINKGKSTQKLVVSQIKPKIKSSDLKGIDTLLGSYSTTLYDSGYGRVQNIKLATKKTSDVILMPGETFSYNKHTGVRSAENGYKLAHVISSGKVAYGIGGGVCQVSSTLFNAVLYSGLDIVSRTNHSIPSTYVDLGRDATVSDSGIDFVFKNNYKHPVFIKNNYKDGVIKCQIFGHKSDKKNIEISTKYGYNITTYRTYYDNNKKEIKKEAVCTSAYLSRSH